MLKRATEGGEETFQARLDRRTGDEPTAEKYIAYVNGWCRVRIAVVKTWECVDFVV